MVENPEQTDVGPAVAGAAGPAAAAPGTGANAPRPRIRLRVEHDPYLNYALQQNAVPIVREVVVENEGAAAVEGLELEVRAEPDLGEPLRVTIDRVAAGHVHRLGALDLRPSPVRLANQVERERGELVVTARLGGAVVARETLPLWVLAYAEWAGAQSLPEILAAFVLPNHPEVERLLGRAREHLARATGNPALDGYQGRDPGRVRALFGAVYQAAADLGLTYVTPPASFERTGQKVRTPDQIAAVGMGTCLDLSLLLAGALEQAGLGPLVLLLEGHACVGVWLTDEGFVDATVDEVSRVTKRVALGEIEVAEATLLAQRPAGSFEAAVKAGRAHLEDAARFAYAVDVRAARRHGIRPLPLRRVDGGYLPLEATPGAAGPAPVEGAAPARAPDAAAPTAAAPVAPSAPESPPARVERWKRRLLDLSLRNRLLNYGETRTTLPLLCPDPARLASRLSEGTRMSLLPRPREARPEDPRDPALYERQTGGRLLEDLLRAELEGGRIHAALEAPELVRRGTAIHRAWRSGLEEGGANTLYLAVGFLRWYESPASPQERRAPVLLLPLEIERGLGGQEFFLRLADEDPQLNVTLLEKLKVDHGLEAVGLDALATAEDGVDVSAVFRALRQVVLPLDRWDVVEEAAVGLFSFTKHLMWLDLEKRTAELARNAVVRHLIETPNEPFAAGGPLPEIAELDDSRSPAHTLCPKDADSSQLRAVHAAADGRTFVLWGPPGTGKSQTITNIIAHAIGHGRRVLFVSEKMAALNVVKTRLEQVGLGAFCLELHSNKAQKAKVLEQIRQALEFPAEGVPADWERQAARRGELARRLNAQVEVLHRPRALGISVFQGLAALVALGEGARVALDWGAAEEFSASARDRLRDQVAQLGAALGEVGPPALHPFRAARLSAWQPALLESARGALEGLDRAVAGARAALDPLQAPLALAPPAALSRAGLEALDALLGVLAGAPAVPRALSGAPDFDALAARIEAALASGREHGARRAALLERYTEGVFALDHAALRAALARAQASRWPLSWWRGRRPRKALKACARGRLGGWAALVEEVRSAGRVVELGRDLEAAGPAAGAALGALWAGPQTDFDRVAAVLRAARALRAHGARLAAGDPEALLAQREAVAGLVAEGPALLGPATPLGARVAAARAALAALGAARAAVAEGLVLDEALAFGTAEAPGHLDRLAALAAHKDRVRELRPWASWRRERAAAEALGLAPLLAALEAGDLAPAELALAFERSLLAWWVHGIYAGEPLLAGFEGRQHEELIRRFQDLDRSLIDQAPAVIRARVAADLPRGRHALSGRSTSEMGILQRELMKRRRHRPLRKLFEAAPNLLARLKPCLLMSPLSVAQFLSTEFPPFDLVVFDEASQIPVWDAIGAIARGRELVVVGDPQQLPPTAFFLRTDDEAPDEDDAEDLESILDQCIAARLPQLRLLWHYRSRHEALIAFSNHHYYDNRLLTFPAALAEAPDLGVSLVRVPEGRYDRGERRVNEPEARRVVAEVVARLGDPERCRRSIGVVTFSLAQQTLIEDLLDEARREQPAIEPYFGSAVEEPVFVKNLENVQGDERDVILFSICYGPDAAGRVALNFGPMNRAGGERRLNVAVTRARRQVVVFSSLAAEQIDLARTNSVGMRHLKHFLEYAERGAEVLGRELAVDPGARTESPFEEEVRRALGARGLGVVPQVGCSGYRVDLGVKDPDAPGRFLLGIECDGAMYHSAKTARDRDRLRQAVLEGLGWTLHRIWSTDWWQDREREIERVLVRVAELRRRPPPGSGPAGLQRAAPPPPSPAPPGSAQYASSAPAAPRARARPEAPPPLLPGARPYAAAALPAVRGGAEAFYAPGQKRRLCDLARRVLAAEAPIEVRLLARRLGEAYGLQRTTDRVLWRVREVVAALGLHTTRAGEAEFLWAPGQDPERYDQVRLQGREARDRREARDVPPEEVAAAAAALLKDQVSLGDEDLCRETARVLGFSRLGDGVREPMARGLERLLARGLARRDGATWVWAG